MSRRYGRNQKRKHRERIEFLETLYETTRRAMDRLDRKLMRTKCELARVLEGVNAVAPMSAIFPPKTISIDNDAFRYAPFESMSRPDTILDLSDHGESFRPVSLERVCHYLNEIVVHIHDNRERFEKEIHLIARNPRDAQKVTHYISTEALRDMRSLPHVYEHVAKKLLHELSKIEVTV